mgnify:CR=1 FL=1
MTLDYFYSSQIVTMHIQSVDQNKAIKTIKHTITELDRSKIEEQKKAVRAGYDMDVLPSDLATYGRDAKALLKELQSQNERMFLVTFLVLNTGKTEQELETNVFQAVSIAQKHNCELCRLDFQQEQGLMSSLPLADCQIEIQRGLTTSSTAIFVPFTTQELFDNGKESLYYGLNALSNNLIMVDRKKLKNPNGLILGTPGSGKSFSAKREICNAFLVTDDDIIIADPEAEYAPLVERLHGQVIHISPASTQYINPMDINSNYSEEDNPLALKADFVLSLCELVVGGKEGLQPVEKTVIDRCVHVIYRKYFENPLPENMPLLEDLYNALLTQDEPEARHVAAALEIYVKGSLNIFNHHTNVDINNRIVCFDIKQLGKQLKKLGIDKSRVQNFAGHLTTEEMSRVDDAVKISLALNPMGSIQKLKPIIRSTAAYAPPEVVDGKPPVYPYTPIKSDFEDAGTVEEMMLYTELQSAVHAMIQRLEYSFTFNPNLLTSPKRKKQVAEILTEAEKYIWRIKEEMRCA